MIILLFIHGSHISRDLQLLQYEIIAGKQRLLILQSDPQVSVCNDHDRPLSRNGASKMRKAVLKPNSLGKIHSSIFF